MCTSEGDKERSPLSFNVLFASSMGTPPPPPPPHSCTSSHPSAFGSQQSPEVVAPRTHARAYVFRLARLAAAAAVVVGGGKERSCRARWTWPAISTRRRGTILGTAFCHHHHHQPPPLRVRVYRIPFTLLATYEFH
jgi:hypothetical protein